MHKNEAEFQKWLVCCCGATEYEVLLLPVDPPPALPLGNDTSALTLGSKSLFFFSTLSTHIGYKK